MRESPFEDLETLEPNGSVPGGAHAAMVLIGVAIVTGLWASSHPDLNRPGELNSVLIPLVAASVLLLCVSLRQLWAAVIYAGATALGAVALLFFVFTNWSSFYVSDNEAVFVFFAVVSGLAQIGGAFLLLFGASKRWLVAPSGQKAWWATIVAILWLGLIGFNWNQKSDAMQAARQFENANLIATNAKGLSRSVLALAAENGDLESVRLLIAQGAKLHWRDYRGTSILGLAAKAGHVEVVKALLEREADLENPEDDNSPLQLAIQANHLEVVRELLSAGAEIPEYDVENYAGKGKQALLEAVLDAKPDLKETPLPGACLLEAAMRGQNRIVVMLLEWGVDASTKTRGTAPLILAAQENQLEVVETLLDAGANMNAQDSRGKTALHKAASWADGYPKIVKRLLDAGADPSLTDKDGRTPLDVATPTTRGLLRNATRR